MIFSNEKINKFAQFILMNCPFQSLCFVYLWIRRYYCIVVMVVFVDIQLVYHDIRVSSINWKHNNIP